MRAPIDLKDLTPVEARTLHHAYRASQTTGVPVAVPMEVHAKLLRVLGLGGDPGTWPEDHIFWENVLIAVGLRAEEE